MCLCSLPASDSNINRHFQNRCGNTITLSPSQLRHLEGLSDKEPLESSDKWQLSIRIQGNMHGMGGVVQRGHTGAVQAGTLNPGYTKPQNTKLPNGRRLNLVITCMFNHGIETSYSDTGLAVSS